MKKIIVYVGISGSGKSTEAAKTVQANPDKYVVVNRDKVRELLYGYTESTIHEYYKRGDINKLEKQITKFEDTLIHEALNENKSVIVDATHLEQRYIDRFQFWNVPIEIIWFDVLLKEAVVRNVGRVRKVSEDVIIKQYNKYVKLREDFKWNYEPVVLNNDHSLPPCVLIDLDGTLAHMADRSPFDWSRVGEDFVDVFVKSVVNSIAFGQRNIKIFICTGRDGVCIDKCVDWLYDKNIMFDKIFIRREKDMRPDWIIKREIWQQITKDYYILGMIDDRNSVVRHARALGLKVAQVEYSNF